MFDSPGVAPCCIAPFVGALVGFLVWTLANKTSPTKPPDGYPLGIFAGIFAGIVATGIAVIGLSFLFGALDQPGPWFEPSAGDVAGTYQVDPSTAQAALPDHSLVFSPDGTFQAAHLPDFWSLPAGADLIDARGWFYLDGSGVWHIRNDGDANGDRWIVVANFRQVNGRADTRSMQFSITGHLSPYALGYNSDAGSAFRFARAASR